MPYIALDIGGSKIALCFTDDAGRRHWARVPVGDEAEPATVLSDVMEQLRQLGARRGKVDQLAIASAPAIDERGMVSRWPNRPRWNGTPLAAVLAECFGCTVDWCDDGTAAAVADAAKLDVRNLLHLSLGTGVAGGLVYQGRLFGDRDLGHLTVVAGGLPCSCGRRGCLQAYASARSFTSEMPSPSPDQAQAWLDRAVSALVTCCANLVEIFRVEVISFGGGMLGRFPELPTLVERRLSAGSLKPSLCMPKVVTSPYGDAAALYGALLLASGDACVPGDLRQSIAPVGAAPPLTVTERT